jgi:acyl-CoA synthetase (AMP-forming)/AMP-acid ligase II
MNAIDYFFEYSKNSDKLFIKNKNEQITLSELYQKTIKIASFIKEKYGTGKNILLCSTNNRFFISCYLGIIKSGNVCVPLNSAASGTTVNFIINETKPAIAFVQKRFSELIGNYGIELICDDVLDQIISNKDTELQLIDDKFNEEQLAEIIYTSGSTAFPKGVMISHKNLIANTSSIVKYLNLKKDDVMLVVLPFHYCYGLSLLHTHLRVGGSIALNNTFMLLGSVINDLNKYECTGFAGVPSHFQIILRKSNSFKNNSFEHLRYVTQAGGKLHTIFIEEFTSAFPNIQFYVMYGQTEATARLTYLPPNNLKNKSGSIGIEIPGVELKLVDNNGCQIDNTIDVGEILAKGDNIMLGYYNDKELTNNSLIDGYLRTGDLARKDEDGYFYLVARKKEIIKVRGERISPKEIESIIFSIPEVVDCTIEVIEDAILGEKIKAIIVVNENIDKQSVEENILRECKNKLSPVKVPQVIEFENNVNVNTVGKKVKTS